MRNFVFVLTLLLVVPGTVVINAQPQESVWNVPTWTEEEEIEETQTQETRAQETQTQETQAQETQAQETQAQETQAGIDKSPVMDEASGVCAGKAEEPFIGGKILQGIVMSADAAFLCWAIYAYFDFVSAENFYNERHSALAPALAGADETLAKLDDEKDVKGLVAAVSAGIAAAAIAYTALDYLQLHVVFPSEVKAAVVPGGLLMTAQIEF